MSTDERLINELVNHVELRVNFEGQAQDLAHHGSRLSGPSRLGSSESSWASRSP